MASAASTEAGDRKGNLNMVQKEKRLKRTLVGLVGMDTVLMDRARERATSTSGCAEPPGARA